MCLVGRISPPRWFLNQPTPGSPVGCYSSTLADQHDSSGPVRGTQAKGGGGRASSRKAGNLITQNIVSRCDRASHLTDGRRKSGDSLAEGRHFQWHVECRHATAEGGRSPGVAPWNRRRGFSCRRRGAEMMGLRDMGAHMLYRIWVSEYLRISPPGSLTLDAVG